MVVMVVLEPSRVDNINMATLLHLHACDRYAEETIYASHHQECSNCFYPWRNHSEYINSILHDIQDLEIELR
jgi:hypothetical protein